MTLTLVQGAYIVAALLFILALAGLSKHESARMGNRYGIIGMTIALVITIIAATWGVEGAGEVNDRNGSGLTAWPSSPPRWRSVRSSASGGRARSR
jgi:NAD(P) transhydrogenase subunit beta